MISSKASDQTQEESRPPIIQNGASVLRKKANPVSSEEFGTPALKKIVANMSAALASCDDGVALAAPQIGITKQIFVVAGKVLNDQADPPPPNLVFINPVLTKKSKRTKQLDEGCLSVRWLYGRVRRSTNATVEAYDLEGNKFTRHATGLLAQIFQHELDHLSGVLFIDKAEDLQEIRPEDVIKD